MPRRNELLLFHRFIPSAPERTARRYPTIDDTMSTANAIPRYRFIATIILSSVECPRVSNQDFVAGRAARRPLTSWTCGCSGSLGERGGPSNQTVETIDDEKRSVRIISIHRLIVTTFHRPFDQVWRGWRATRVPGTARTMLAVPITGRKCRRRLQFTAGAHILRAFDARVARSTTRRAFAHRGDITQRYSSSAISAVRRAEKCPQSHRI